MILAVSDIHLGYEKCNKADFLSFVNKCDDVIDIDHLILLGDILDFWRKNKADIVKENAEILTKLGNLKINNIHYIFGNHDLYMQDLSERWDENYPFKRSRSLRLKDGGNIFYFIHGYELEVFSNYSFLSIENYERLSKNLCFAEDISAITTKFWNILGENISEKMKKVPHKRKDIDKIYNFAVSGGSYILLGMKRDERLIFGHTHRPFINKTNTIANTGSWVNELSKKSQNTYIKILNGRMELKKFDQNSFP